MTINGKEYTTPAFTFGDMCKLEGWGLPIDSISERPLTFLSGFVALAIGRSNRRAESHRRASKRRRQH